MPFNFDEFAEACAKMTDAELAIKKQKYNKEEAGSGGGAATSGLFLGPFVIFTVAVATAPNADSGAQLSIIDDEMSKPGRQRSSPSTPVMP
jgi:hypothetical protein